MPDQIRQTGHQYHESQSIDLLVHAIREAADPAQDHRAQQWWERVAMRLEQFQNETIRATMEFVRDNANATLELRIPITDEDCGYLDPDDV